MGSFASSYTCHLDQAGCLPLRVSHDDHTWHAAIDVASLTRHRLIGHLLASLRLECAQHEALFTHNPEDGILVASLRESGSSPLRLSLNGRALAEYIISADGTLRNTLPDICRLSVMELRMLGQYPHTHLPYPRPPALLEDSLPAPITDLHTHLSSQVTSEDLLEAAALADASYPVELLRYIGLDVDGLPTRAMPSQRFTPAASEGLACEQEGLTVEGIAVTELLRRPRLADALSASMAIAADAVITFDELERRIYRMRNPLAKHPGTVRETILRVAQRYAAQGVVYAELAVTAALNPHWLATALPALEEAQQRHGVALRLLVALPRSLPPAETLRQLELVRLIARHPAVVGIDFLGYEANKTRNFGWALSNIARWAAARRDGIDRYREGWDAADDFIIRVHAGENGKNPDNVAEVLALAQHHGVRVRVGHAAYGNVEESLERAHCLASSGLLMIEFNPDSNMAMNNIDHAGQLPIAQWASAGIPFVIASDGAGIYRTDRRQLLSAGVFAGLGAEELALMRRSEEAHIALQERLYENKQEAFRRHYAQEADFIDALRALIEHQRCIPPIERLKGKIPLLIAGASGGSWARIDPATQEEIRRGIRLLVRHLNPARVCFAMGRIKHEGIGRILDEALSDYLAHTPRAEPFDVVGMLSQHQNMPALASHINHIVALSGELMSVPTQMTALLAERGGCALYIGGSAFTRDFIHCSEALRLPFGVMEDAAGASAEKSQVLDARYRFRGAEGMLEQVRRMIGSEGFLSLP